MLVRKVWFKVIVKMGRVLVEGVKWGFLGIFVLGYIETVIIKGRQRVAEWCVGPRVTSWGNLNRERDS